MKAQILANLNMFDKEHPEWCLPPKFWTRAQLFEGYQTYPLGAQSNLPVRQCHTTTIRVIEESHGIDGCSLALSTGYVYSENVWTRHSWIVNPPDMTLLECTPSRHEKYFGVTLTPVEYSQFKEMMAD